MSTNRPYLLCHMMCSLDGKITSGTGENIFDDEYLPLYDQTDEEQHTQGWMCGRVTMEMFAESVNTPLSFAPIASHEDFIGSHRLERFSVAIDTQGVLLWKSNIIKSSFARGLEYTLIVVVTKETPGEYLAYLQSKDISYVVAGEKQLDWNIALTKLHTLFGVNKLSVQGGGKINGSLLRSGCIDELSLLIIPFAVNNSSAPNIFENEVTPETFKTYGFRLKEVRQLEKEVVWLKYQNISTTTVSHS